MLVGKETLKYRPMDPLGELCIQGVELAGYLHQVPDDREQWARLRAIVDAVVKEAAATKHQELPKVAEELRQTLAQPPSRAAVELLQAGFDRLLKLWKAAKSGIH